MIVAVGFNPRSRINRSPRVAERRLKSIPRIASVIFDFVTFQEGEALLLKRPGPVMVALSQGVRSHVRRGRLSCRSPGGVASSGLRLRWPRPGAVGPAHPRGVRESSGRNEASLIRASRIALAHRRAALRPQASLAQRLEQPAQSAGTCVRLGVAPARCASLAPASFRCRLLG